jgi:hypothetical protein
MLDVKRHWSGSFWRLTFWFLVGRRGGYSQCVFGIGFGDETLGWLVKVVSLEGICQDMP